MTAKNLVKAPPNTFQKPPKNTPKYPPNPNQIPTNTSNIISFLVVWSGDGSETYSRLFFNIWDVLCMGLLLYGMFNTWDY